MTKQAQCDSDAQYLLSTKSVASFQALFLSQYSCLKYDDPTIEFVKGSVA